MVQPLLFPKKPPTTWYGFALPFRPTEYTYGKFIYQELPLIHINPLFQHITTFEDLRRYELELDNYLPSATNCYFDTYAREKDRIFYQDYEGTVFWSVNSQNQVCLFNSQEIVADSIPEFLSRIKMENDIWYKIPIAGYFHKINEDPSPKELNLLTSDELDYILHYKKIRDIEIQIKQPLKKI